ncbi:hypothetical protein BE20_19950 [Sorangium cellulosum]|nr:hypothetical protein BE20_19950 [Sorangium cellulosum]
MRPSADPWLLPGLALGRPSSITMCSFTCSSGEVASLNVGVSPETLFGFQTSGAVPMVKKIRSRFGFFPGAALAMES